MKTVAALVFAVIALLAPVHTANAGWLDWINPPPATSNATSLSPVAALTEREVERGLKEALSKGVGHAVSELGRDGGFLKNLDVKIPMPEQLRSVEKALRLVGQDKMADEFVTTLNHAAEQAVPAAAGIFAGAITNMTVTDVKGILRGPHDAATEYFRKTCSSQLTEKMLPIVKTATAKVGVTGTYKQLMQNAGPAAQFLGGDVDLDSYVTHKSLDGLFKMIAAEEKRIRENPVARTTDLLKKVFGSR